MTANTLPVFEYPELNIAPLPMHVMSVETHECVHCGEAPIWDTFEGYEDHFWKYEYEGERYHRPDDREEWEAFTAACNAAS